MIIPGKLEISFRDQARGLNNRKGRVECFFDLEEGRAIGWGTRTILENGEVIHETQTTRKPAQEAENDTKSWK